LIVLVLVLIWLMALAPVVLRKLSEEQVASSVARFRQSTSMLRRRFSALPGSDQELPFAPSAVLTRRPVVPEEARRRQQQIRQLRIARRRRTLLCLTGVFVLALALGAVPHLHLLWIVALTSGTVIAGYLALLAYFTNVAANVMEQRRKVVAIRPRMDPAGPIGARYARAVGGPSGHLMPSITPLPTPPAFVLVDAPR